MTQKRPHSFFKLNDVGSDRSIEHSWWPHMGVGGFRVRRATPFLSKNSPLWA